MIEKEYIVTLQKNVDHQAFDAEMVNVTGAGAIPKRTVGIAHARPASKRNTHYMLTDDEATFLRADARVMAVEIPPEQQDDIVIGHVATQTGDFTKTASDSGVFINWGLKRVNEATNTYTGNFVEGDYNYTLDGSGIDIVIQDSGLQIDHPEFQDASGASRVVELDWYTASGLSGAMPPGHYTDYDGHGTHCAGIAAGKTYGWAKNSKVYAVKVAGLQGSADPNSGIPISGGYCFDVIKEWHKAKPIDPNTGVKRPTVVNMSWGYGRFYTSVTSITFKGLTYSGAQVNTASERSNYGLLNIWDSINQRYTTNIRIASVDADIQELIDEGVHVFIAAGNRSHKIDSTTGDDYNNSAATNTGTIFYHRGSSPYGEEAIMVGSTDSAIHASDIEQKASYSETGPGVDMYSPGTNIMSCTSTVNKWGSGSQAYLNIDATFKQTNISGTSMATPQAAGLSALYLQANPDSTPAQTKAWLLSKSKSNLLYTTNLDDDYTQERSLLGGANKFTFNPFNSGVQLKIGSTTTDEVAVPTYVLSSSVAAVNEGSTFVITLTTTNVANGTNVPYTITGVSNSDIADASLTGNFTVTDNTASITYTVSADVTSEGSETFIISLDGLSASQSVTINDTSESPGGAATYAISPAANNVDEGNALVFNITTANVVDATTLYWTVTNAGDFGTSSGNFTITSDAGSVSVTPSLDTTTEGSETFTMQIRTSSISGTIVATSSNVTINDTSTAGAPSYSLGASSTALQEGEKTTVTLTTTNVVDATNLAYTISGVVSDDLNIGPRASSAITNTVGYGSNFFTNEIRTSGVRLVSAGTIGGQAAVPDEFVNKVARMFQLFTDVTGSGINTNKQNLVIETLLGNTTSYHAPYPTIQRIARGAGGDYTVNFLTDAGQQYWGLSPLFDATVANDMVWYLNSSGTPGTGDEDAQEVIEHVFHTLHMHGLDAATLKMYPTISADWATSDLHAAMKEAADASMWDPSGYSPNWETDAGEFELGVKEYLYLLNFCMFDYSDLWSGGSLAPEWNNLMRTPAGIQSNNPLGYALFNTHIGDVISKPSLTTIRNIFQDGDTGNPSLAGSSGYVVDSAIPLTGNFTVTSNSATLEINTSKDGTTDGDKTLAIALDNGEASQNISITDSSQTVGPTYYAYPSALAIDEGSALTINVVTTGVADGSLYWTVTNAGDFSTSSGTFALTSDTGAFSVTPTADTTTEGSETFTVEIRTGSDAGAVVFTTPPITINDTSVTPSFNPDWTITVTNSGFDYLLSGTDANGNVTGAYPALTFNNGDQVQFNVDSGTASSHPFYIKTATGSGTGSQASGAEGNGTTQINWTIGSTGTFHYQCSLHGSMNAAITVS